MNSTTNQGRQGRKGSLRTANGGEIVGYESALPIDFAGEEPDEPIATPEDMHAFVYWAIVALGVLVLLCALMPVML
ncbi:MAG: hypothetical protein H0X13_15615 [Ramlibacter sp.]|nr:hypothetical protein [Ramlibacter sp.]